MYEIPQQLKYEEKIVFGLTLPQFAAVGIAGAAAMFIFFKTGLPMEAKALSSIAIGAVGMGFAFFDLKKHLSNITGFYSQSRETGYLDKQTLDFVEVKEVKNDSITLKNNQLRSVLQVFPINFGIKSDDEKDATINSYQEFLNSISFPIQIVMRTVNLNLSDYLEKLEATIGKRVKGTKNSKLMEQFSDYRDFVEEFIENNAVKDRLFYIIIPANTEKDLDVRTEQVMHKLNRVGLSNRRLHTDQLVSLLASFFEGYIEVDNDYLMPITLLGKHRGDAA